MNAFRNFTSGVSKAGNALGNAFGGIADAAAVAAPDAPFAIQRRRDELLQKQEQEVDMARMGRLASALDSIEDPEFRLETFNMYAQALDFDDEVIERGRMLSAQPGGFTALYQAYGGQEASGRRVSRTMVSESGEIINVFSDGSVEDTGRRAENRLQFRDVGGVPTAFDSRSGAPAESAITPEEVGENKGISKVTENEVVKTAALARSAPARAQKIKILRDTIKRAKRQSTGLNTGRLGSSNPFATNLDASLRTIKANIGFEELQAMRDASPTGGALGQVAVQEIMFLQTLLGDLDRSQTQEQLDNNLDRIDVAVEASWARVLDAYEETVGRPYTERRHSEVTNQQQERRKSTPTEDPKMSADELVDFYLNGE